METGTGHGAAQPAAAGHPASTGLRPGLVIGAIGIVFGDIGTSPLYTFQECVSAKVGAPATDPHNVLGVTSLIAWMLTLVVTIKYLAFLMRADNHGEGGVMALLALVPSRLTRAVSGSVGAVALLVIIGASLLFGDGIITPAISVLSAIEGLGVAAPSLKPLVVPVTVAILIGLFAVQRRGTGRLGVLFGPVMVVWFVTIGGLGLFHVLRTPAILAALSPYHAYAFFAHHGLGGVRLLGGVVLAVTGGEALYADMGHFGARPIRFAWLVLVFPALLLCYLGQGANLLAHPEMAADPFYGLIGVGSPYLYPMVVLASLATVIASQGLITGVFSLTHQAVQLGFFPRVEVRHTSTEAEGQIYVPLLNTGLAVSCVALVLVFRESGKLAAAYGLAVTGTMLITSIIFYVVTRYTWNWKALPAVALLCFFLSFDLPLLLANSIKFFDGGYLPFTVGLLFTLVMVSWRVGRSLLAESGTMVVLTADANNTPPVLARTVGRFQALYEHTVVLTVTFDHQPWVDEEARFELQDAGQGFLRVRVHFGFMESPDVPAVVARVLEQSHIPGALDEVVYAMGRETLIVTKEGKMGPITEPVFAFLVRNARSAANYFSIPPAQVVEIGVQLDL